MLEKKQKIVINFDMLEMLYLHIYIYMGRIQKWPLDMSKSYIKKCNFFLLFNSAIVNFLHLLSIIVIIIINIMIVLTCFLTANFSEIF